MTRPEVVVEVVGGGRVGSVCDAEPPGSFASHTPTGREVFIFGWLEGVGPGVWRSAGGVDVESLAVRAIASSGFERIANLTTEAFELDVNTRVGPLRLRFRYNEQSAGQPVDTRPNRP